MRRTRRQLGIFLRPAGTNYLAPLMPMRGACAYRRAVTGSHARVPYAWRLVSMQARLWKPALVTALHCCRSCRRRGMSTRRWLAAGSPPASTTPSTCLVSGALAVGRESACLPGVLHGHDGQRQVAGDLRCFQTAASCVESPNAQQGFPTPNPFLRCAAAQLPAVFEDTSLGYIHDGMLTGQVGESCCSCSSLPCPSSHC